MVEINRSTSGYLLSAIYVTMSGELVKPSVSLRRCLALSSVLALPVEGDGGCVVRVLRTAALGNAPL
jgi:hypothetical protein